MSGLRALPVAIVRACLRQGAGGSPTAVLYEAPLSDDQRRRVPVLAGTSHAVFVAVDDSRPGGEPVVSLRFFTAEGELPACGHGTVAALAFLAERAGGDEYRATLHASGRSFAGWSVRVGAQFHARFEAGTVDLREPTGVECGLVLPALGITPDMLAPGARVASVGRSRLLVPVRSRSVLVALDPDFERLRAACDRLGFLGSFVYCAPMRTGRVAVAVTVAARMFAPSIGVPEDIANANSTACLASHLAGQGITDIAVDMGDSLGSPSTITATATATATASSTATRHDPAGRPLVHLGGTAEATRVVRLASPVD
ncbi:PhzF family phenazine biosynthesis isomerase [Streptomyces sp. NPDC091371]|uniref:PhzF family phenazine biosynthesis protein n=1 Tax=Streptomyces sp. NPDC091371 TaxID=3155303 RepID=UPI003448D0CA